MSGKSRVFFYYSEAIYTPVSRVSGRVYKTHEILSERGFWPRAGCSAYVGSLGPISDNPQSPRPYRSAHPSLNPSAIGIRMDDEE